MSSNNDSRLFGSAPLMELMPTVPDSARYLKPLLGRDENRAGKKRVRWRPYLLFALLLCTLVLGLAFWFVQISKDSLDAEGGRQVEVTASPTMALIGRLDLLLLSVDRPGIPSDVCKYDIKACHDAICRSDEAPPKDYCQIRDNDDPYRRQARSRLKPGDRLACKAPGFRLNYQYIQILITRGSPCGIALV